MDPNARADSLRNVLVYWSEANDPNIPDFGLTDKCLVESSDLKRFVESLLEDNKAPTLMTHPYTHDLRRILVILCKPLKLLGDRYQGTPVAMTWGPVGREFILWENPEWEYRQIRGVNAEERLDSERNKAVAGYVRDGEGWIDDVSYWFRDID